MVDWYSVADEEAEQRLVAAWEDAPIENLETMGMLLSTAQRQIIAYAPALDLEADPPEEYPEDYALWQLRQAQNLWNAGRVGGDGGVGAEGYSFQPRPLDKTIKEAIRPKDVSPRVY